MDGQTIDGVTYKRLVDYLGTNVLPNLNGRYLRADTTPGTMVEAGLPNITGSVSVNCLWSSGWSNGCFTHHTITQDFVNGQDNQKMVNSISFDASRSSAIYGKSDTVTPLTYTVRAYICYA